MAECYQHQPCGRHATSETRKFKVAESSAGKHVVCQDRPWIATPWQLSNVISWCGRCGWTSSGRRRRRIRTSWCTAVMQQAAVGAVVYTGALRRRAPPCLTRLTPWYLLNVSRFHSGDQSEPDPYRLPRLIRDQPQEENVNWSMFYDGTGRDNRCSTGWDRPCEAMEPAERCASARIWLGAAWRPEPNRAGQSAALCQCACQHGR